MFAFISLPTLFYFLLDIQVALLPPEKNYQEGKINTLKVSIQLLLKILYLS